MLGSFGYAKGGAHSWPVTSTLIFTIDGTREKTRESLVGCDRDCSNGFRSNRGPAREKNSTGRQEQRRGRSKTCIRDALGGFADVFGLVRSQVGRSGPENPAANPETALIAAGRAPADNTREIAQRVSFPVFGDTVPPQEIVSRAKTNAHSRYPSEALEADSRRPVKLSLPRPAQ